MNRFRQYWRQPTWLSLAMLAALVMAWSGCKPSEPSPATTSEGQAQTAPSEAQAAPGEGQAAKPAIPETVSLPAATAPTAEQLKPRQILEAMVAKYKAATSYADKGTLRIQASLGGQKMDESADFLVAMARPNKLRMEVYQGKVVCDGKDLWGFVEFFPDQVLKHPAPAELSFGDVFSDQILASALTQGPTQGFSWVPPQLLLLWAEDPLKTILYQAQEPVLAGTKAIDGKTCYGIDITRPEGKHVLWIEAQSYLLRRIEYPMEELARQLAGGQPLDNGSLVVDFREAEFDPQIGPEAFQFERDPAMEVVENLAPATMRMLGKPAPEFKFVDLEGKEVTPKSLEGKTIVLDFWATWCGPCRMTLPLMEKVYEEHKNNDKVAFLAVSIDKPEVSNDQLRKTFEELKVNLPIGRDAEDHAGKLFHTVSIPTMFVIGSNGLVQYTKTGMDPMLTVELRERLAELLAGRDIYSQTLSQAEEQRKNYQAAVAEWAKAGLFTPPGSESQEVPKAEVAAASQPKTLKLTSLWKSSALKEPGNILVVPRPDGSSQVFVLDGWKSVVELAPDGNVVATPSLALDDKEAVSFLRTAVDANQKRYFLASGMLQLRAHVFDENWKLLVSYPADALDNPHTGILDVQVADLDGNGSLEMCLGYFGVIGVQGASLEGQRLWSNRSIDTVMRIAILDPDAQGKRNLLCTNNRGTLLTLDNAGNSQGELQVPNAMFHWIAAADLDGTAPAELCGLSARELGVSEVIGLNLKGESLWTYPLPKGVHERPVEQIVPGKLNASGPGQWLVPAADGSIHVIAADGKPIDQFNYGAVVHGLATAMWNGQPVLLVASANGVEAFQVSWPVP